MCCCIPEKDWVDIFGALLTPVIAIAGIAIGILQWRLSEAQFRHQLFDKRFAMYEAARDYIGGILEKGFPVADSQSKFLKGTSGSLFLFDSEIGRYMDEIWSRSVDLESLHLDLSGGDEGSDRAEKLERKKEQKAWFDRQLREIEGRFSKRLSIRNGLDKSIRSSSWWGG